MQLKRFGIDVGQMGVLLGALLSFVWFEWWIALVMTGLMVLMAFALRSSSDLEVVERQKHLWLLGFLFLTLFLTRWFPFWLASAPLGFDTGIYRYEFFQLFEGLPSLHSGLFPGLPLLAAALHAFGISLDQLMVLLPLGFSMLLGMVVFSYAREHWSGKIAIFTLFLLAVSLVQWKVFEMMLLKQLFSLSLLITAVWLFEKRSWLLGLVMAFLVLVQPLDGFLLGLGMLLVLCLRWKDRELRSFLIPWVLVAAVFVALLFFLQPELWSQSWNFFMTALSAPDQLEYSAQTGVFMELRDFGFSVGLVYVLGFVGWGRSLRREGFQFLSVFLLVLVGWIGGGLFFWQRLLIMLELVLIFYSAQVLDSLWTKWWRGIGSRVLMVLLLVALVAPMFFEFRSFSPLVEDQELASIQGFCDELEAGEYVMVTDGVYGPWLRGYCPRQRLMAPELFEYDPWTLEEWKQFWIGNEDEQAKVIGRIDHPFYAYVGQHQYPVELPDDLFESLGNGWYAKRP